MKIHFKITDVLKHINKASNQEKIYLVADVILATTEQWKEAYPEDEQQQHDMLPKWKAVRAQALEMWDEDKIDDLITYLKQQLK